MTTCTASAVQRYKSLHSEYSLCRSRSGERSTSLYTYTLSGAFSTFACLSKSFTAAFQACNLQFLHHNLINQIFWNILKCSFIYLETAKTIADRLPCLFYPVMLYWVLLLFGIWCHDTNIWCRFLHSDSFQSWVCFQMFDRRRLFSVIMTLRCQGSSLKQNTVVLLDHPFPYQSGQKRFPNPKITLVLLHDADAQLVMLRKTPERKSNLLLKDIFLAIV